MVIARLFAYGTLLPDEPRWSFLEQFVVGPGVVDVVAGDLFDTGEGYPAAVFGSAGTIHGRVFELAADRLDAALVTLDEVEGAVHGLYHRVELTTAGGRTVWAYQYGGGLALRPIRSGSWADRGMLADD